MKQYGRSWISIILPLVFQPLLQVVAAAGIYVAWEYLIDNRFVVENFLAKLAREVYGRDVGALALDVKYEISRAFLGVVVLAILASGVWQWVSQRARICTPGEVSPYRGPWWVCFGAGLATTIVYATWFLYYLGDVTPESKLAVGAGYGLTFVLLFWLFGTLLFTRRELLPVVPLSNTVNRAFEAAFGYGLDLVRAIR